jgi:hypothetical protein
MKNASISEMKVGLRIHALVFVPCMLLLLVVNMWTGAPYWVQWVLLGWGSGLAIHAWAVSRRIASKTAAA